MTKYVLSSDSSVISNITDNDYSVSNISENAIKFNTFGYAMTMAIKINKILGNASYRVISIEV